MNNPKGLHAWTARVGEKGQIVIPKEARDLFGINPGDTLLILGDERTGLAIPQKAELARFTASILGVPPCPESDGDEAEEET